jgi:periplasmic divalent cation tolerance protein
MIIVYTTCKDKKEVKKISDYVLRNKLAACVNSFGILSYYLWKGKIRRGREYVCIIKTSASKFRALKEGLAKISGYDIPCIMKININDANNKFIEWMNSEIR